MLHFVTSYMKQNKSRKQTLDSAQYGLEISFKETEKSTTLPSLLYGMFHAHETSELFACENKVFEYKYISILNVCELKQRRKCEQSVRDTHVL